MRSAALARYRKKPGKRYLDILTDQPELVTAILESVKRGVYRGIEARGESQFMPAMGPNMISYIYSITYLGEELYPLGYQIDTELGQQRYISPHTKNSLRLRFTMCRGDVRDSVALVNTRGPVTRRLVEANRPFNPQLSFDGMAQEIEVDQFLNVWIYTRLRKNNELAIWAAVVGELNEAGNQMLCWESEMLGTLDMNTYELARPDLPESVVNVPSLSILPNRDGTHD